MRDITTTERYATAAACVRMFPEPRWSYLRSALEAAWMLRNADEDYLGRMDNRAYQARVLATNLALYRAARSAR